MAYPLGLERVDAIKAIAGKSVAQRIDLVIDTGEDGDAGRGRIRPGLAIGQEGDAPGYPFAAMDEAHRMRRGGGKFPGPFGG